MSTVRQTLTVKLAHAEIRIAELEASLESQVATSSADLQTIALLQEQHGHLMHDFVEVNAAYVILREQARKVVKPTTKCLAPRAAWVRAPHMEAARQQAMATGRVVLV